jgi:uncharacterized RDD family membrane protein YckC
MPFEKNQGFIQIQSTELFFLENELANVGSRAVAYILDTILKVLAMFSLYYIVLNSMVSVWGNKGTFIAIVVLGIIYTGYHAILEFVMSGKTPGKMVMGLRVLKSDGSKISLLDSLIRNILRIVDIMPYGYMVAMVVMFFEKNNRRVGDLVADTIVIYDRTSRVTMRDYIKSRLSQSKPSLAVTISGLHSLTPQEKSIIKTLYERINTMDYAEKLKILEKFQNKFSRKIKVTGSNDPQTMLAELYKRI